MQYKQSNKGFIRKCDRCGVDDYCLSSIKIWAGYGSKHDGLSLTLDICGDCMDEMLDVAKREGRWKEDEESDKE